MRCRQNEVQHARGERVANLRSAGQMRSRFEFTGRPSVGYTNATSPSHVLCCSLHGCPRRSARWRRPELGGRWRDNQYARVTLVEPTRLAICRQSTSSEMLATDRTSNAMEIPDRWL